MRWFRGTARPEVLLLVILFAPTIVTTLRGGLAWARVGKKPMCLMSPDHIEILFPIERFTWLQGEEETGPCQAVPLDKWTRKRSGALDLFVYSDGPSGSGRYWTVTVGIGKAGKPKPDRGTCLTTSTVGWRTLQYYRDSPLPWLDDVDGDGEAELILWASFPLRQDASTAEYGLTSWVYRLDTHNMKLDWDLSRRMARNLAAAYRAPLSEPAPHIMPLRAAAAAALSLFAEGGCSPQQSTALDPSR